MKRNVGSINLWDLSQLLTLQPLLLKRQIQAYTKEHLRLNIFSCISRSMKAVCNSRCHFKCHLPQLPWARRRVQIVLIFHQWKTVWKVMFINTFLCWLSAAHARSEQGVKALGEGRGSDGWMKPFSSFESLPQWGHSSMGDGKESDDAYLCWLPMSWRCTGPENDRESFFQAKANLCFHNTVGSWKCKPHRLVPGLQMNNPLLSVMQSLNHLSSTKGSLKNLKKMLNTSPPYTHTCMHACKHICTHTHTHITL